LKIASVTNPGGSRSESGNNGRGRIYNCMEIGIIYLIFDTSNSLKLEDGKRFFLSKKVF